MSLNALHYLNQDVVYARQGIKNIDHIMSQLNALNEKYSI